MVGKTISHYHIVEKLGEGGMGVVYKARDTRLDRFVAIKVLSARAALNPDRQLRFIQEAKTASGLNHPNIITVHDIDNDGECAFIVMEFVDGKTLDQLIASKGLRTSDILHIAVQIADALAAAHGAGIVHRDIKPANIMIADKGMVKVLDFGLAKLAPTGFSDTDATAPLTINRPLQTDEGVIMGTVAYMSPEQAQGEKVDARSDIFSFGALLYEMFTGRRAFHGENRLSVLAAILNQEPRPPSEIVEGLPREVERTISLCMRKNPARRFQHMADLKVALEELKDESDSGRLLAPTASTIAFSVRPPRLRSARIAILLGTLMVGLAAGWIYIHRTSNTTGSAAPAAGGGRLTLLLSSSAVASDPALSLDGKMIVYTAEEQGQFDIFVSRVAGGDRIRITNDPAREAGPHFSPDGERIVFTRIGPEKSPEIWVVPVLGGQASRLVADALDAAWSPDGARIALISRRPGQSDALATVAADGNDMRIHARGDELHPFFRTPAWSPDGTALAVVRSRGGMAAQLWLVPLNGSPRSLTTDSPGIFSNQPVFTPDGSGIIHQSNRGGATNLWMQPLNGGALVQLTTGPGPDEGPSVARDGSVAFVNARFRHTLIAYDLARGQSRDLQAHSTYLWAPAFSPDGRDVAFSREEVDGSWHIWVAPVAGGAPRRLTSGAIPEIYPRFSPEGAAIVFNTWGPGANRIYRVPLAGGPSVPLTPADGSDAQYGDVSSVDRVLAFARAESGKTHVYVVPLDGGVPRRLIDSESTVPRWSPDGRWLAFSRSRANTGGVWVVKADGSGVRQLSETGSWPTWWPGGKQLGYLDIGPDGSQQVFIVPFEGGQPRSLSGLKLSGTNNPFDVSPDGALLATSNAIHLSSEIWLLRPQR